MEYSKPDENIKESWHVSRLLVLIAVLIIVIPLLTIVNKSDWNDIVKYVLFGAGIILCAFAFCSFLLFPIIEYKQWGYIVEEDKVIIRHGIFYIKTIIIPVIRIQNITIAQGPVNKMYDLYNVQISLASGSFDIVGLTKETADSIGESLRSRIYSRIKEKGAIQ